ncbi:MAG TPA: GNAT family N-acetyltransferase [Candidatus Limnocylindria bacterium]|nr:GNAT family N-acetyltransferase [Candidatus Limnocylindria bacterium]
MTPEPADRAGRLPALTVRDATPADAPAIARVAAASWRETYRYIFEPAFIERFLGDAYSVAALEEAARRVAQRDGSEFLVAERGGRVVGYLGFGSGRRGPELFRIYADPAHYGTGVGGALLDELHRRIAGRVASYLLDVHSRNERGRAFYARNGFVVAGGGATPDCDLTLRRTLEPARPALPVETERLRLRSLTDGDEEAEALHAIYGDAETMRYIGSGGRPTPHRDATRRMLHSLIRHEAWHGFGLWAVDERESEETIGIAGLAYVEDLGPEVELAYLLRRDRWGHGYAAEAAAAALRVAFDDIGLGRVIALAYPENRASIRVMEKIGMRRDGTQHAYGRELVRFVAERS